MADNTTRFIGSIPEIYDTEIGPYLFDPPAIDLARRVATGGPARGRLLEIACGTGIATKRLREALPDGVDIVATDLTGAMLDYAATRCGDLANVAFRQADALDLPFADDEFDAVVCQFGIMFFPDKARGLAEMARVLKPGGLLALNVWDSLAHNALVAAAFETTAGFFESDPPAFLSVPFNCREIDPVKDLLQDAGFADLDIGVVRWGIEAPSARGLAVGLVEGNPGIMEIRARATAPPEPIVEAAAKAIGTAHGDDPVRGTLQEIVYTARKPG